MIVANEVEKYLKVKKSSLNSSGNSSSIDLFAYDINKIENSLGSKVLNSTFVKFEEDPITVKGFLENLKYDDLKVDTSNINSFAFILNETVKNFLESQLLVREGYKLGLETSSDVRNDLSIWESYYLSQALQSVIYDSIKISDTEARDFFSNES